MNKLEDALTSRQQIKEELKESDERIVLVLKDIVLRTISQQKTASTSSQIFDLLSNQYQTLLQSDIDNALNYIMKNSESIDGRYLEGRSSGEDRKYFLTKHPRLVICPKVVLNFKSSANP